MSKHSFHPHEIEQWLATLPDESKIVLATGVFDLLHSEHRLFLQKAKEAGDVLIVGIETDSRVRQLKGENRPIWSQDKRYSELKNEKSVDFIFVLPEEFGDHSVRERVIAMIKPDILAVSSHTPHLDKKRVLIEKYGGQVMIVHQHNPTISTTKILASQ